MILEKSTLKRMKLDSLSVTLYNSQLQVNQRPETLKLLQLKIGKILEYIGPGNYF
jgi:hypothetical protein